MYQGISSGHPSGRLFGPDGHPSRYPGSRPDAYSVVISGAISAGKTTTIAEVVARIDSGDLVSSPALQKYKGRVVTVQEHFDTRLLEGQYRDPATYSTLMQLDMLAKRIEGIKNVATYPGLALFDRSIFEDRVFAKVNHKNGDISDDQYGVYTRMRAAAMYDVPLPDLFIILRVDTATSIERCRRRQRPEEDGIPPEYLGAVVDEYETHIAEMLAKYPGRVVVVDNNGPPKTKEVLQIINEHVTASRQQ